MSERALVSGIGCISCFGIGHRVLQVKVGICIFVDPDRQHVRYALPGRGRALEYG